MNGKQKAGKLDNSTRQTKEEATRRHRKNSSDAARDTIQKNTNAIDITKSDHSFSKNDNFNLTQLKQTQLDFDKKDRYERTVAHHAAGKGDLDIIKRIGEKTEKLHAKDTAGMTPIHYAAENGKNEIIKEIYRMDPHTLAEVANTGDTAAHYAMFRKKNNTLKILYELNESIFRRENNNKIKVIGTILRDTNGYFKDFIFYLYLNQVKEKKQFLFFIRYAIKKKHIGILNSAPKKLHDYKYEEKEINELYKLAIKKQALYFIKALSTIEETDIHNLVNMALKDKQLPIFTVICRENSSRLSEKSDKGSMIIHQLIKLKKTNHLKELLRIKPSCTQDKDKDGLTAAHMAAISGECIMLKILHEYNNTCLMKQDNEGKTPAHYSVLFSKKPAIHLLESLAPKSFELKDKSGLKPTESAHLWSESNALTRNFLDNIKPKEKSDHNESDKNNSGINKNKNAHMQLPFQFDIHRLFDFDNTKSTHLNLNIESQVDITKDLARIEQMKSREFSQDNSHQLTQSHHDPQNVLLEKSKSDQSRINTVITENQYNLMRPAINKRKAVNNDRTREVKQKPTQPGNYK